MKSIALLLVLSSTCCYGSVPENLPEVQVCLHFKGETSALEQDSTLRLTNFIEFYFGHLRAAKTHGSIRTSINGLENPSSVSAAAGAALKRQSALFELLMKGSNSTFFNTQSWTNVEHSEFNNVYRKNKPVEECDARVSADLPGTKTELCNTQFGICQFYCSAKSCEMEH